MAKRIDRFENDFIDSNQEDQEQREVEYTEVEVEGEEEEEEEENEAGDEEKEEEEEEIEEQEEGEEEIEEKEEGEEEMEDEEEEEGEEEEQMEEEEEEEVDLEERERGGVYEPLRKRQKAKGPHRINELPDSLLIQILSFLDTDEAGRTGILSKRWRFLWTYVPNFIFSNPNRQTDMFVQRVYRALLLHKPNCVRKFALNFQFQAPNTSDVDVWIQFTTASHEVEELSLRLVRSSIDWENYQLPQHVFNNTSFRKLELSFIKVLPSGSVSWTALKRLSLEYLVLTQETVGKILSGSPLLEFFSISNFLGVDHFKINSSILKEFVMQKHYSSHARKSIVEISVPNLLSLHISGDFCGRLVQIKNVQSLVSADIDCHTLRWKGLIVEYKELSDYVDEVLASFHHVKELKLGAWLIEIISILAVKGIPFTYPSNLKVLTLESPMGVEIFPGFFELLQSSPDLETLVIERIAAPYREISRCLELFSGRKKWTPNWGTTHSFLQHLRIVKVTNFVYPTDPNDSLLILVEFLLQNAKVLEKMEITAGTPLNCSSNYASLAFAEVAAQLLRLPRSSPKAFIVFLP